MNRYGHVPALRHRGLTIAQSNMILTMASKSSTVAQVRKRPALRASV